MTRILLQMGLRLYFQMLYRGWWIILITSITFIAIVAIADYVIEPIYSITARFIIIPNANLISESDLIQSLDTLDKRSVVLTYAEVLNSTLIYNNSLAALGKSIEDMLSYRHTAVAVPNTNIIELTVLGPDASLAAVLANTIGEQGIQYIQGLSSVFEIRFLDPAIPTTTPSRPQPIRDVTLAGLAGVFLGLIIVTFKRVIQTPLETLLQHSVEDSESQAYNRPFIIRRLDEIVHQSENVAVSLGFIHLDGLDTFMQIMPRTISQQLLRQSVQIMRNELRGNDVIGRWGETTFAVLLPNTSGSAAVSTLGRVQLALSKPIQFSSEGETLYLYPKIGIVERQKTTSVYRIIDQAERALQQAIHGKTGLVLFRNKFISSM
jgi:diguanylate cyclase (GGDEF)-like protein